MRAGLTGPEEVDVRAQKALNAALLALVLFSATAGVALGDDDRDRDRDRCEGKRKRGCQVPEVPYSAILPAATMAGAAGFYFVQRRRSDPRAEVSVEDGHDR